MKCTALLVAAMVCCSVCTAQEYSDSQTNNVSTFCIGCNIQDPDSAVGSNTATHAQHNITVATLGAYTEQQFAFSTAAAAGDDLHVILQDPSETLLNTVLMGSIEISTSLGGGAPTVYNNTHIFLADTSETGNVCDGVITTTAAFDEVTVRFKAGIVGALNNVRLYAVFHAPPAVLPAELEYCRVIVQQHANIIEWATLTEQNSSYFEVLRSHNGINFEVVAKLEAQQNSNYRTEYNWHDLAPVTNYYYQLREVDANGAKVDYAIQFARLQESSVTPTRHNATLHEQVIELSTPIDLSAANEWILVLDMSGKIHYRTTFAAIQRLSSRRVRAPNLSLAPGSYVLIMGNHSGILTAN